MAAALGWASVSGKRRGPRMRAPDSQSTPERGSFVSANDETEKSLAHLADTHGVWLVSSVSHPTPLHPLTAARHCVNKGRDVRPSRPRETRPAPERAGSGGERPSYVADSSVKADLDETEPPAERLRRYDGDTGSEEMHSPPYRGECASTQALPSPKGVRRT